MKIGSAGLTPDVFAKTGGFPNDNNPTVTTAEAPRGQSAIVLATAEDADSGIQNVGFTGSLSTTCVNRADIGERKDATIAIPTRPQPDTGRPKQRAAQFDIGPSTSSRCKPGFRFAGGELSVAATAFNGVGGTKTTATVTVTLR